jgi:hypothetical protein
MNWGAVLHFLLIALAMLPVAGLPFAALAYVSYRRAESASPPAVVARIHLVVRP